MKIKKFKLGKAEKLNSQSELITKDSKGKLPFSKADGSLLSKKIMETPLEEEEQEEEKDQAVKNDEIQNFDKFEENLDELIDEILRLENTVQFSTLDEKIQEELLKNLKGTSSNILKTIDSNATMSLPDEIPSKRDGHHTSPFRHTSEEDNYEEIQTMNLLLKSPADTSRKKAEAPMTFTCFICGQDVDCGGNYKRMNNHIDRCLKNQNETSAINNENSNQRTSGHLPEFLVKSKKRALAPEIVAVESPKPKKRGRKPKSVKRETSNIESYIKK